MTRKTTFSKAGASFILVTLAFGLQVAGGAQPRQLALSEARELVVRSLEPTARNLPGLALDTFANPYDAPGFYSFEVSWANPHGSVIVGHFAVNKATGDVWEVVSCERIRSDALRALQKIMRSRIGLRATELHRLEGETPCER
jgi:hypothetical protein